MICGLGILTLHRTSRQFYNPWTYVVKGKIKPEEISDRRCDLTCRLSRPPLDHFCV